VSSLRNYLDVNDAAPNGADIRTASDAAMQAEAKRVGGPVIQEWIKAANEKYKGLNAKAALDEFHAELKKVAAGK